MAYTFFIYGLAFFVLGFAIFLYPKKGSAFKLACLLNLIACFGVLHGVNEWLDLFIPIGKPPVTTVLDIIRMLTLSFVFLVWISNGLDVGCVVSISTLYSRRLINGLCPDFAVS